MIYRNSILTTVLTIAALSPAATLGANRHRSFDELAADSDKVLIGTVGVKASHWGEDSRIYTDVVVSPDVTIKGNEEGAVTVRIAGGAVGDTKMTVSDGPEFPEGGRVVVFLRRERDHYEVSGRSAGSMAAASPEAADAVEGAFRHVEGKYGRDASYKRGLAAGYINGGDTAVRQKVTSQTNAAAVQTGCYSVDGAKWGTTFAAFKIGSSIPSTWAASINASAATWSNAGAGFRLVNDGTSLNELSLVDLVAKYGSSYSNTYAVTTTWSSTTTNQISKATIEINTKWQWSVAGEPNMADVQNILTHEFGHWMRLLDIYSPSTCSEVTMFGTAALGETKKRTLDQADIDGFKSLYGAASAIGAPTLTSPANAGTGVSSTPTLTWTAGSGATSYDVYFGTSAAPGLVATIAGSSYQPGTLTAGTTYYWRVVAKNSSGSASSATWSFTTAAAGSGTLAAPVLLSPANGATGVSLSPVMRWNAVQGASAYDIYVGTTAAPTRIGTVSGTAVTVSGFQSGVTYYWKIVARLSTASSNSAVWSFRTQ